ncbi:hypothetical protein [Bartonella pachyuromydis]|uniref:hypothetical protein n=1 Tax=Bartonella pachyuromydis TaxID=931097 RepID=UPI0031ECBA90
MPKATKTPSPDTYQYEHLPPTPSATPAGSSPNDSSQQPQLSPNITPPITNLMLITLAKPHVFQANKEKCPTPLYAELFTPQPPHS